MGKRKEKSKTDPRKPSLYLPEEVRVEMVSESVRLDRSVSWIARRAWGLAKAEIRKLAPDVG